MITAFLLILLYASLALRLLPFYYVGWDTAAYAGVALAITLGFIGCVAAHNLFHLRAARYFGVHSERLILCLWGNVTSFQLPTSGRGQRISANLIALLLSFALTAFFYFLSVQWDMHVRSIYVTAILFHIACANLTFVLVQSLPILPLDGGRLFLDVFSKSASSLKIVYWSGQVVLAANFIVGALQIYGGRPVLGGWFLLIGFLLFRDHLLEFRRMRNITLIP